ncbi:MAG TPA: hypothetical protein VFD37_05225 [Solirubrobacterales bacterium]|nr:hypothetical protein [Solirubrobacterales bacterium]
MAEVSRHGDLVLNFDGGIRPRVLPRTQAVPVRAEFSARVRSQSGGRLPGLTRLKIEINRNAQVRTRGLPLCPLRRVRHARTGEALNNCGDSVVGEGSFGVEIHFPDQLPNQARGRIHFFHSRYKGAPALIMHGYVARPAPVAVAVPLRVERNPRGPYGMTLSSPSLPAVWGNNIRTTRFRFDFGRLYRAGGRDRSYLSAACRAPNALDGAFFNLARATYEFTDGARIRETLLDSCRVSR